MSVLSSLLVDLKQHAVEAVAAAGQPVSDSAIVNGAVPWDNRCPGWLFVRNGPAVPLGGDHRCGIPLLVHSIFIGTLRCIEVLREDGSPPTTAVMTEEALEAVVDQEAIQKMLNCDFNWTPYTQNKIIVGWTPLDPSGQFMGGEWQVDVRLIPNCGC